MSGHSSHSARCGWRFEESKLPRLQTVHRDNTSLEASKLEIKKERPLFAPLLPVFLPFLSHSCTRAGLLLLVIGRFLLTRPLPLQSRKNESQCPATPPTPPKLGFISSPSIDLRPSSSYNKLRNNPSFSSINRWTLRPLLLFITRRKHV